MSTMDYLEFKNHLEHSFTQKDQADYYSERSKHQVWQAHEDLTIAGYVNNLKNKIAKYKKKKKKMSTMKEGQSRSNLEKECKDLYESIQLMRAQVIEWVGPDRAKNYNIPKVSAISHSSLEHASIAGASSRLRSKMQSAIYKKTGYQSKGSYAGAPNTAKQATTDQNKAVANARFSANIKSAIEACNRDAAEAQSVYVEATTRINNIVSRNHGEVNSIIRSVNEYNENVRNVRKQTFTRKSTFGTVANGKLYQGVREEEIAADPNRQFISFSAGAQKLSANKYVYKPKMLLIDSDPGTYKEV